MENKINVMNYNPEWRMYFTMEGTQIRALLEKNCENAYHVGNTAIEGLNARPIIDILAIVKDLAPVDALQEKFEEKGYECKGEFGVPNRRVYVKDGENIAYRVYVLPKENKEGIDRLLHCVEYLKSNHAVIKEYNEVKAKLAEEFADDVEGYCKAEEAYMEKIEKDAVEWKRKQEHLGKNMGIFMFLGIVIGSAVSVLLGGGVALGSGVGMFTGMIIGAVLGNKKK